ncbi:MAG: hypothetical protein EOP19_13170 [Hyphomicrobiales bacterium]|nr:MAG: hypothetical protein EOP19_13170 [Hyphomicrobiales bacterium]
MSFWKNLFGGGGSAPKEAETGEAESYKGFTIRAKLMPVGSEYQLAGSIEKDVNGETKVYEFVRADRFGSREDVQSFALAKARQIIDEQGNTLFQ